MIVQNTHFTQYNFTKETTNSQKPKFFYRTNEIFRIFSQLFRHFMDDLEIKHYYIRMKFSLKCLCIVLNLHNFFFGFDFTFIKV